jgi:hypothetical protein
MLCMELYKHRIKSIVFKLVFGFTFGYFAFGASIDNCELWIQFSTFWDDRPLSRT